MYQLPVLERVANLLQKRNPAGFFLCSIHSTHFLPRLNWKWHKPLERSLSSGCRPARGGGQRGSFRPHSPQGFPCGILAPSAPSGHRSRRPRAGQRLAAGSSRRTPHCPHSPHTACTHCPSPRTHRPSPHSLSLTPHSPPPPGCGAGPALPRRCHPALPQRPLRAQQSGRRLCACARQPEGGRGAGRG